MPTQLADALGFALRRFAHPGPQPVHPALAGQGTAVAVGDAQTPGQQLAQHAIGLQVLLRVAAAQKEPEARGVQLQQGLRFGQQPALAQARLADDRGHRQVPARRRCVEQAGQCGELGVAADHRCVDALDAASGHAERARLGRCHEVGAGSDCATPLTASAPPGIRKRRAPAARCRD
jgi:hypothetical protein